MFNMKTLLKVALGIGLVLFIGYTAFPQSRALIAAIAPYLLLALPLVLCFSMAGMHGRKREDKKPGPDDSTKPM